LFLQQFNKTGVSRIVRVEGETVNTIGKKDEYGKQDKASPRRKNWYM
jgi:hypothetical protein